MWYKNMGSSFFNFVTVHTFDRLTDGWLSHRETALHAMHRPITFHPFVEITPLN